MRRSWMLAVFGSILLASGCPQPSLPAPGDSPNEIPTPGVFPSTQPVVKPEPPARAGPHRPLSAAEEAELLAAVRKFNEADHKSLGVLKLTDPTQYRAQIRLMWIWYGQWKNLPPSVQQAYWALRKAKADTAAALARWHGETNPAERTNHLGALREAQGREFDALQIIQAQWAEEFAQRIDKLQKEIDTRRQSLEKMRGELKARQLDREKILDSKVDTLQKTPPAPQPEF